MSAIQRPLWPGNAPLAPSPFLVAPLKASLGNVAGERSVLSTHTHTHVWVYTNVLADVRAREAFYQSMPSLRPLSYKYIVQSWSRALLKTYTAKDQVSMNEAQQEFKEYEVDIVKIVGEEAYQHILLAYQRLISMRLASESTVA